MEKRSIDLGRCLVRDGKADCHRCEEICPQNVPVSESFAAYNEFLSAKVGRGEAREKLAAYKDISRCISCGSCEKRCPQNIEIRKQLQSISDFMK